jgi:long-chain acyl-CoA synthetase
LILPAEEALKDWCMNNSVEWTGIKDAITNEKVLAEFQRICEEYNPEFAHIEQIKKFKLLAVQWEPMKGDGSDAELTPTLKLKRRVIREKHQNDISNIYNV